MAVETVLTDVRDLCVCVRVLVVFSVERRKALAGETKRVRKLPPAERAGQIMSLVSLIYAVLIFFFESGSRLASRVWILSRESALT